MEIKKILVPVDGSDRSLESIEFIKGAFSGKELEVHLINVVDINFVAQGSMLGDLSYGNEILSQDLIQREMLESSAEILDRAAALLPPECSVVKASLLGISYNEIVEYAERECVDIIVITKMGLSSIQRFLIGSVTSKVVSHASVPVLVLPEELAD